MTIRTSFVVSLSLFVLTMGLGSPASAQSSTESEVALEKTPWVDTFGQQVRTLLETGDPERQSNAMRFVLYYAGQRGMDIDFSAAVPALFDVYENEEDEGLRILALRALNVIGDEQVRARLAEQARLESTGRVRAHTIRMLTIQQRTAKASLR